MKKIGIIIITLFIYVFILRPYTIHANLTFEQAIRDDNIAKTRALLILYPWIVDSMTGISRQKSLSFSESPEMTKLLLDSGADPFWEISIGHSVVNDFTFKGDLESIKLVYRKAHIDRPNSQGETLLHIACFSAKYEIVKYAVEKGADVNLPAGDSGKTPLGFVASHMDDNTDKIIFYLLEHGAELKESHLKDIASEVTDLSKQSNISTCNMHRVKILRDRLQKLQLFLKKTDQKRNQ